MMMSNVDDIANDDDDDLDDSYDGNKQGATCADPPSSVPPVCSPPPHLHCTAFGLLNVFVTIAKCMCPNC